MVSESMLIKYNIDKWLYVFHEWVAYMFGQVFLSILDQ